MTLQQGVAWFPVTFTTAGQDSLVASDTTTTTVASATANVSVVDPTAVAQIVLFAPRSAQTGVPVTVEAVALNAFGQEVSELRHVERDRFRFGRGAGYPERDPRKRRGASSR